MITLCELKFVQQGLDESNICVLTSFDAGFAKEEHLKSQSGFVTLITSQDITEEAQWCNICEFQSSTISRRVRSTLAAESASLSLALDRHLFARLLVQAFIYGEPEDYTNNWREELLVPGIMTTDAASLYEY